MKRYFLYPALFACVLGFAGCASVREIGRNYPAAQANGVTLGKTTRVELMALMGEPYRDTATTSRKDFEGKDLDSPLVVHTVGYFYANNDPAQAPDAPAILRQRSLTYYMVDNVVVGSRANSTFQVDSTEFDIGKSSQLKKNITTIAEVEALFGKPTGVAVHPIAAQKGGQVYFYSHNRVNTANNRNEEKTMNISFGADARVTDFNVTQKSTVRPVTPQPVPIVVPIYIPARR